MFKRSKGLMMAGLLGLAVAAQAAARPTEACMAHSAASLDALVRGDYAGARKDFSPTDAQALDAARLEQVWRQLQAKAGAYQKHAVPQRQTADGHSRVVTRVTFANAPLNFVVACDAQDRITTFLFQPATTGGAASGKSRLSPVKAYVEANGVRIQPLAVSSPPGPLQGVLTLPAGKGPFPAVVLVAGSGPEDRDETIGPNKPLRDIADGLAAAGIASLRYDKRTLTYGREMAGKPITVDDEVTDDALTALHLLHQQKQIDPHRVFVLGHSLGAYMAPRIARRDPQLAGVIMLAAPVALDFDTIVRQMRYIARVQHLPAATLDKLVAPVIKARDALAHANPAHPPAGLFFHAPASYWLVLRDYHAVAVAQSLTEPMLILQGGGDYQVLPKDNFAVWKKTFAGNPRVKLIEYPGLSHLFMPAGNPPSPADYGVAGHVDAKVLHDIAAWIKAGQELGR